MKYIKQTNKVTLFLEKKKKTPDQTVDSKSPHQFCMHFQELLRPSWHIVNQHGGTYVHKV